MYVSSSRVLQTCRYAAQGGEVVDTAVVEPVAEAADTVKADTAKAAAGDLAAKLAKKDTKATDSKAMELAKKQNPLFSVFQPTQGNTLAVVGYANARDTAEVNKIIFSELAGRIFPAELKLRWGAKPENFGGETKGDIFELYALKITEPSGRAPLEGDVITNGKDDFDQMGHPCVSMQMNSDGARRWSQITKQNIGKAVAIVLDDANPAGYHVIHRCLRTADDLHDHALRLHPWYSLRYRSAVQPVLHTGYPHIVPGCPDNAWYRRYRTDTGYCCGC